MPCIPAEHLRQTTSTNAGVTTRIFDFLNNVRVISWIEYVATTRNLSVLGRTANSFRTHIFSDISKHHLPWVNLFSLFNCGLSIYNRIVAWLRTKSFLTSPSAIFWLIPPFCPRASAIATASVSIFKGITVQGLTDEGWDDRLSCIDSHDKTSFVRSLRRCILRCWLQCAGSIVLHHNTTCLPWKTYEHRSPVRHLLFGTSTSAHLVSCGRRDIKIWEVESGFMLWIFTTTHDILTCSITNNDNVVNVAARNSTVQSWDLQSGLQGRTVNFVDKLPFDDEGKFKRPPLTAAFSPDMSLIAIVFRGRSICLYDLGG